MICPSPAPPPIFLAPALLGSNAGQILLLIGLLYAPVLYYFLRYTPRGRREKWIAAGVAVSALCMLASWALNNLIYQPWQLRAWATERAYTAAVAHVAGDCFTHYDALTANIQRTTDQLVAVINTLQLAAIIILVISFVFTFYLTRQRPVQRNLSQVSQHEIG